MQTIKKGDRGEAVKTLQRKLNLYPDGIFGPLTEEGVKSFQWANGLKADGIVGPATWEKLLAPHASTTGLVAASGLKKSKRRIDKIILHCTATPEGRDFSVEQIRQCHLARNFSDIGYHYVIYRDGSIHDGRDVDISGAHCSGQNAHSIGVCYVGGTDAAGRSKDTRTEAQKAALKELVARLQALYGLDGKDVHGHYEYAAKDCPCFNVQKEFNPIN